MGTCFSSSASRHFSFLFLPSEPPCLSLVAFSLFLAVLFLVSCFLFLSPPSIMAVVVVVAVVDHLIMVGVSCGGCKGRLTGLPLVDFALQASVTRDSPSPESRFTPQPTTKPRTPGQGERTESQEANGASRLSSIVKRRQQQRLGRNSKELSAVAVRGWSRQSRLTRHEFVFTNTNSGPLSRIE
jgi:hypothetical protein